LQFGLPATGAALPVDVRVRAPCAWKAIEVTVYYHRDFLTPVSSNPTVFSEVQKGPAAGDWVDNAGDNLAGTFTLPDGTTDEYDFVVTIVGTPAAPVSSNANQGVLIGSLGFTVKAGLPTGATGHLTADGEVVCTDDTTRPLSGVAATGSFVVSSSGRRLASGAPRARASSLPVGRRRPRRLALVPPPGATGCPAGGCAFGDINGDGIFDISDLTFTKAYLTADASARAAIEGGMAPWTLAQLDADQDKQRAPPAIRRDAPPFAHPARRCPLSLPQRVPLAAPPAPSPLAAPL